MSALVLVEYPKAFLSASKFARKVDGYTRLLENPIFCSSSDINLFLRDFCESRGFECRIGPVYFEDLTHAVVFDSGGHEELRSELNFCGVKAKFIEIKLTSVVNKESGDKYDIYIGRGTSFGNPYPIGPAGDRAEVIRKYKYDFDRKLLDFFVNHDENVSLMRGKVLGCHCKPYACHGDIISDYINGLDDGK